MRYGEGRTRHGRHTGLHTDLAGGPGAPGHGRRRRYARAFHPSQRRKPRIINCRAALRDRFHPVSSPALLVRPSTDADLPAIAAIYADAVRQGTGTFEIEPPDGAEIARRRADVRGKGLPWLVAEAGGTVLGYAYANHFRPRQAYRHTLEDSIYLHADARGRGVGRLLLAELLARCEAAGARQMLAVIGDSGNAASVALHRSLGFAPVGTFRDVGRKFDRWLDVVLMQRALGPGAALPPAA